MNEHELNNQVDQKLNLILECISNLVVNKRNEPKKLTSILDEVIKFIREKCY